MDKKTDNDNILLRIIGLIVPFGLVLIFVLLVVFPPKSSNIELSCEIDGIQYMDVSAHAQCWNDDFDAHYCPMPTKIACSGAAEFPFNRVMDIIKGV